MPLFQLIQRRRRRGWLCGSSDDEVIDCTRPKATPPPQRDARGSVEDTRTGSSSTAGDESSSNDSRHGLVEPRTTVETPKLPKWKAENFLADGPFVDADWWEDCDDSDSSSSSSNSMNDDGSFFSDDDESRISVNVEELQQYYEQQQQQASRNAIDAPRRKRFCNRGLQIWCQARQSWRTPSAGHRGKKKKALPIPESFRKELVKCLVERRQFELSQSIPLSCVINAYEQVWHENGCD